MQTITFHNEKGGVGKSTLAVHLAAALAIQGETVALVDTDPQSHAAALLGMPAAPHLYDLLVRDADWEACLQRVPAERYSPHHVTPRGALLLCASNREAISITQNIQNPALLAERLDELRVDVAIVDTSPTPSMLNALVFFASDGVVIPTRAEYLGLEGVNSTAQTMQSLSANPALNLTLLGVQPNAFDSRTAEHADALRQLRQRFGPRCWEPVPNRIAVAEASALGRTMFAYNTEHPVAQALWGFADNVTQSMKELA